MTRVAVIGAGVGGLAAAARLAASGHDVTVIEGQDAPGGRMRALPSAAGPVDAGPTVLTMRWVFEDLFAACGASLAERVPMVREEVLARHFWPDGSTLDLLADPQAARDAVAAFAGPREAAAFDAFRGAARRLFGAFEAPMMRAPDPSQARLAAAVARRPWLLRDMAPHRTLAGALAARFRDPRLRQLFGRYATYVGGDPRRSPALLSLIFHSEATGVWRVEGGMRRLAEATAELARGAGARIECGDGAAAILRDGAGWRVARRSGAEGRFDAAVFAGDPRALREGLLGPDAAGAVPAAGVAPRSLSAEVWAFAARAEGPALAHHDVFFAAEPEEEFAAIAAGRPPAAPTLYLCAQDRGAGMPDPAGAERFEIIANAAPLTARTPQTEDEERCRRTTFETLERFGLRFDPAPGAAALTGPAGFEALSPGSAGSLYGRSPHGMTAALARPRARTALPGLYLAGGGAHPGAGVPMAALSGAHAAAAISRDRTSTSRSRRGATAGGTSTGSRRAAPAGE